MRADIPREVNPVPPVIPAITPWPVDWGATWVGALAGLATALIIGLAAIALGANQLGPAAQVVSWHQFGLGALIFGIVGSFFSFVVAGWVAAKIAGVHDAETGMLHGAIAWLIALPILVILAALGAGNFFGGWYGGLAGTPIWANTANIAANPQAATIARNAALGTITAILLSLVGSVIGGWLGTGERMWYRVRPVGSPRYPHRV